jgi:hypothetical protein
MTALDRKHSELRQKLRSVEAEFEEWRKATAPSDPQADPPPEPALEKHYSQVLRVTRALEVFAQGVDADIRASRDAGDVLARSRLLQQEILEVHRLWQFFRSKLALRFVDWMAPSLAAADDLAFACYSPAQAAVPAESAMQLKEPPLVYFSGASSPLAVARGETYEAEAVEDEPLRRARPDLARRLPIAVVEIPWSQRSHLPDAPAICHEVGHIVEYDMQLTSRLHALLTTALDKRDAPPSRRGRWSVWLGEVFADVYGCLGAGPAFPLTLLDLLVPEALGGLTDPRYPPADLRMALNACVLEKTGHGDAATALMERWDQDLAAVRAGPAPDLVEFVGDAKDVVQRLLEGPYPELQGRRLPDLLEFTEEDQRQASAAAEKLLAGKTPETKQPRRLHAAARLAFDKSPDGFDKHHAGEAIVQRVMGARETGPRGRAAAPAVDDMAHQDEALGREILGLVRGAVFV